MALNDFATLGIRVATTGVEQATGQLARLGDRAGQVERATNRATGEVTRFGAASGRITPTVTALATGYSRLATVGAAAGAAVAAVAIPVGRATVEFQKQQGMLATATGSIDSASQAYEALAEFAAKTPYSLQQATDGFVQLVNLGLTPSERALTSYGNTAAAMGRDLSQMVEAVADASVGEFERLKEFGIKASAEGDRVRFTFRGTTTEVAKDAAEIESYLIRLGETQFGDAMARQAETLGGALSNLGDSWDRLMVTIGKSRVGELMESTVRGVTSALDSLRDAIDGLPELPEAYADTARQVLANGPSPYGIDLSGMLEAPEPSGGSYILDAGRQAYPGIAAPIGGQQRPEAAQTETATGDRLARFGIGRQGTASGTTKSPDATGSGIAGPEAATTGALDSLRAELATEEEAINAAFARRIAIVAANTEAESTLRAELVAKVDAQRTADLQSLADHATAEQAMLAQRRESEHQALTDSLMTAEEAITGSYERRRTAILAAEELTGTERTDLMARLETQYQAQQQQYHLAQAQTMVQAGEQGFGALASLGKAFAGEQSSLYRVMFAASKAFAIAEAIIKIQQGIAQAAAVPFPANLAAMATVAAATASIVPTITSANYAGGYDEGGDIPPGRYGLVGERGPELVGGPARVISRVATASALQSGVAQRMPGGAVMVHGYDAGGTIPRGKMGVVGERGPEIVLPSGVARLPSRVTAATPAPAMPAPVNVAAPHVTVPVRVINSLDPTIVGEFLGGEDGERLVLNVMRRNPEALRGILR